MKGTALETVEELNQPFDLKWHPGNPGFWEAVMGEEEVRASSASPDIAIAIVLERYQQQSE